MYTTRLLIVIDRIAPEDFMSIENLLSNELDQLLVDIVNLKEHLNDFAAGNFIIIGSTVISTSFNIETTIVLNANKKLLKNALHTLNNSSKCYIVYVGTTCPLTGDWFPHDKLLSNNDLISYLSELNYIPDNFFITGVHAKELWLQEVINLNENKKVFIRFRNENFIFDSKLKELVHQLGLAYLSTKLIREKENQVNILFKKNLLSLVINKYKICISNDVAIVQNEHCQLYLSTGKTIFPGEFTNLPFTMTNEASNIESKTDSIIAFPKGTTMLYMQINVGHLDLHYFGENDSKVLCLVWAPYLKKSKVVRLVFAEGDDFAKFIDGLKQLLKDKLFHSIAGLYPDEKFSKDMEFSGFKLPLGPSKNFKSNSVITSKSHMVVTSHQKSDSISTKLNTKDTKDSQSINKKIKTEVKSHNIGNHKDKPDSVKEKIEVNKIKTSAPANVLKTEKTAQVKDRSCASDKNIKTNQVITKCESVKKTGKADLNPSTLKHASKEIFNSSKSTLTKEMINKSDATKKKIKSTEVAVCQVNQVDVIENFGEKGQGITNGDVNHLDKVCDQGIESTSVILNSDTISNQELISNLSPLSSKEININDTISNQDLNSILSPQSSTAVNINMICEVDLVKKLDDINACESQVNGTNNLINYEEVESLNVNGINIELNNIDLNNGDNIDFTLNNLNGDRDIDENYEAGAAKCNELDNKENAIIKCDQIDTDTLGFTKLNVSNNALVQDVIAIGGSALPNHEQNHSNIKVSDILIEDMALHHVSNENEAPRSPGYKQFVHDYEVSILAEPEPYENFLDNLEPVTSKIVEQLEPTYMSVSEDLNKVHDLSNVSLDDDLIDDKDILIKTNETTNHICESDVLIVQPKPLLNGAGKTNTFKKPIMERMTSKKTAKLSDSEEVPRLMSPERKLKTSKSSSHVGPHPELGKFPIKTLPKTPMPSKSIKPELVFSDVFVVNESLTSIIDNIGKFKEMVMLIKPHVWYIQGEVKVTFLNYFLEDLKSSNAWNEVYLIVESDSDQVALWIEKSKMTLARSQIIVINKENLTDYDSFFEYNIII